MVDLLGAVRGGGLQPGTQRPRNSGDARLLSALRDSVSRGALGARAAHPVDCRRNRPFAIVFGPRNPGASSFFIYGTALLGRALPVRHAVWGVIGQVVLAAAVSLALVDADLVHHSRHRHFRAHRRCHHSGGGQPPSRLEAPPGASRSRAAGEGGRARADCPRPARPARAHTVRRCSQERARTKAALTRPRPRTARDG